MKTYILANDNIYYLENGQVVSVEFYTGLVHVGFTLDDSFAVPFFNGTNIIETGTAEQIEEKIEKNILTGIKTKYEFHRANGWNAYQDFRAKIVNDIYKGFITEEEAFFIEANLSPAFDQISATGDWKTARYKLIQVTPYPPFVEPYYNLAMQLINDYIINNYED
ncbi:hypothetical protein [Flavobacterium sp. HNIBRBA15423]|uniref:hypothetical protein n=1 Tax=Flavobacterium sp. HNIBRBA15423 TaxID=3458683 RepID=UPI0040445391